MATVEQVAQIAEVVYPCYGSLVLLATYGTLRFGELFGLQRKDVDLATRTVSVERQATHLADGTLVIGPPKSDAGRRVVSLPSSLIAVLDRHLAAYVSTESEAWVFRSLTGSCRRKSNWSVYWRKVAVSVGIEGLHFHDLRHTGNTLAATTGASTKELMSRMGHASTRAAILYQHATRERDDAIAAGLDALIAASSARAVAS